MGGPAGGDSGPEPLFGDLVRQYRRQVGLSQEALAAATGLGVRTVRDLEKGRSVRPQRHTVLRLAQVFGLEGEHRQRFVGAAAGIAGETVRTAQLVVPAVGPDRRRVPLSAAPADFCGRRTELELLVAARPYPSAPVVVHGPPGVGKTTLVLAAAHRLAADLPDGAFQIDLRGGGERPMTVLAALARLLGELGVPAQRIPAGLRPRIDLYAEVTADWKALLVLDNALDADQVEPLLPTGPGWTVLVSSRRRLSRLIGVDRLALQVLPESDAEDLMVRIVGAERLFRELSAARELVELCGGLPLALRIVGSRLASRPGWAVAGMVRRLRQDHRRLDAMQAGDVEVRSAFAMSYRQLGEGARTVFRRLALLPWSGYDPATAAELLGVDPGTVATQAVNELHEAGLLQELDDGDRSRMLDLLVLFGKERAAQDDGPAADTALDRVRRRVLATVVAAGACLPVATAPLNLAHPFGPPRFRPTEARQAMAWLEAERSAIAWAIRCTTERQQPAEIVAVVEAVRGYAERHHHAAPWHEVFELSVAAAQQIGDPALEARHRDALGFALKYEARRPAAALAHHERARQLHAELGDRRGEAWSTLYSVGALQRSGRLEEAARLARVAAAKFADIRDSAGSVTAAQALGDITRDLADPWEAARIHRRVLAQVSRADPAGRVKAAMIRYRLGEDLLAAGDCAAAIDELESALAEFIDEDHPTGIAESISALAETLVLAGREHAGAVGTEAVRICRQLGDVYHEARAWYALGLLARRAGHSEEHRRCWHNARTLTAVLNDRDARQLAGLLAAADPGDQREQPSPGRQVLPAAEEHDRRA